MRIERAPLPGTAGPGRCGVKTMHESRGAKVVSMRVAGRTLRKTEILGLFIFILMAVAMLAVGTALFYDWLAEPGSAPVGTPADIGPIPGGLAIAGAIPIVPLVIGVQVAGAMTLVALYLLSSAGRRE
jgi:multicomponent Na+:H+ antiporter subunit B